MLYMSIDINAISLLLKETVTRKPATMVQWLSDRPLD